MDTDQLPPELPPKYYRDYFHAVLEFVNRMYASILSNNERQFLENYYTLSDDAQCLFIRLSNRRKSFFRTNSLAYPELIDIQSCLEELHDQGFVEAIQDKHTDAVDQIIDLFTKPELLKLTASLKPEVSPSKSIRKPDLMRWLLYEYNPERIISHIDQNESIVKVTFEKEIVMFKYLFFGNLYADMSEFVIRDLGHVKFENYDETKLTIRFNSRKEVEDHFTIAVMKHLFVEIKNEHPPEEVFDWFMNWQTSFKTTISSNIHDAFENFALKIAIWLEKKKLNSQALNVYELTNIAPARERRVRLMYQAGNIDEALALCLEIGEAPINADEKYFSIDFKEKILNKKKRSVKQTTLTLNEAKSIEIPISFRNQVEVGAMHYYDALGYNTLFSENSPWRSLFGLLFWDIIYDTNVNAIHNPLQRSPSDFFTIDFYYKRKLLIDNRLKLCNNKDLISKTISETYLQKEGIANNLVSWYDGMLDKVLLIINLLTVEQINVILLEMAQNLRENTRGFPDILIWNEQGFYEFIEIKSPTDHLAPRQLHWIHFFEIHKIPSRIVRVKWIETDIIA